VVRWFDLFCISEGHDNLAILYLGASPDGSELNILWEEDYNNPLNDFDINVDSYSWKDLSNKPNFVFPVDLPSLKGLPTSPHNTGIDIRGEKVFLKKSYGWFSVKTANYSLIPINTVDCGNCGRNCDTCPHSPWYELHFIYYSEKPLCTGFGIFYIYPYNQTYVQLNYTLSLPSLQQPAINYDAVWSGTLQV